LRRRFRKAKWLEMRRGPERKLDHALSIICAFRWIPL
jgi:hypothetical protein